MHSSLPIPGLPSVTSPSDSPDLVINLGHIPTTDFSHDVDKLRYTSKYLDGGGQPSLRIWEMDGGLFLRMIYSDGTEFWIDREVRTLWAHWSKGSSLKNTLGYLLGPVLGLLLRLRGIVSLHASVVELDSRAVIFVGAEGAGKSTTAAAFARRGFAVLSDDIAALRETDGKFYVLPGYPRVNLWPDSVRMLYGSPEALPPIMNGWEKRCLTLGSNSETQFAERPLPIGAIYILGDPQTECGNTVESISQKTGMLDLVANTYATNFLDAGQRGREFAVLSRLVTAVPVRKINPRREVLAVQELCEAVQKDFAGLPASSGPVSDG